MPHRTIHNQTLEFIAAWQDRTSKQQRRFVLLISVAIIVAFVICMISSVFFKKANEERIVNQNMNYIHDSALQEADQIENKLGEGVILIGNLAKQYDVISDMNPSASIRDRLETLTDKTIFDRIGFVDAKGIDTTLEGTADVSDRDYYKRAMEGESGYEFIPNSRVTNKPTMIFYAPLRENNKITGALLGFYEVERLDDLFSYEFMNYVPDSYLLTGDGDVIANSMDETVTDNMLTRLSQKEYNGETDFNEIQAAIADSDRTSVVFNFVDEGKPRVGVIIQFSSSSMMLLSVLQRGVSHDMIQNANRSGNYMLVSVCIVFAVVLALFFLLLILQNRRFKEEMTTASDGLYATTLHEQKQSFIIDSLSNTYSSVYFVEIEEGTYERIIERETTVLTIPEEGLWSDAFARYQEKFVDVRYRDDMDIYAHIEDFESNLGEDEKIVVEYQRSDDAWRRAVMLPAEYDEEGKIMSVIFAVQRIDTEKKKEHETQKALQEAYEAAQLASEAKTTFLSNVSHDIRTPMNAIIGMTAIAGANIDNKEKIADCLKKINASSRHLLALINEILDMSKIESGKIDLSEEDFNLAGLIEDLILINQPLINEKNHLLTVRVNQLTHEDVIGDRTRLQQVFTNLLTNAIKYTPTGGKIDISITEKQTNKSNVGWYEFVIADNGMGMTEEYMETIFDPFSRAKDDRISKIQGTGLGMPIARNIARMMNGDITVKSELNKGSEFTVQFALRLQKENNKDYAAFMDLPVLVVDDDITACESTCLLLDSILMKSEFVTSGREAVNKTVEHHERDDDYYALIVDWKMPDMSGIETTREIRKRIGGEIPIIVMSAYDWTDIEKEAREAGVNAFLSKPLFKSKLVNVFSDLLGGDSDSTKGDKDGDANEIRKHDFSGARVLLAEDNELNSEIASEILSMMGIEVDLAENGRICVDKFNASEPGRYNLIFMDIQMPVMDGYEAAREIRKLSHPDAKNIPIIAMTANAFSTDVRNAYDAGMNGHISKPIEIANVVKALEENL